MPQYLLSVCFDEPYDDLDLSAPETQRLMAQTAELTAELERAGAWGIADLDAALDWAAKASTACERPFEVRPTHA